ncbi:MAG: DUF2452 domain-containing protein [Polyangiaceae bacterium]|nr:DUF2452 domain-containing protein [Polyangiaceae bacterium]
MAHDPTDEPTGELIHTRSIPYPTSRLAARIDLVDMAQEIEKADQALGLVVGAKLEVIRDQMRALQEEARQLLEEARLSARLQRAKCNFKKIPGKVYHLYRRPDGELYFSMLSPDEWGGSPPHVFEGSYKVEIDLSLRPLGDERSRPDGRTVVSRLLKDESYAGELTGKT